MIENLSDDEIRETGKSILLSVLSRMKHSEYHFDGGSHDLNSRMICATAVLVEFIASDLRLTTLEDRQIITHVINISVALHCEYLEELAAEQAALPSHAWIDGLDLSGLDS